MKYIIVITDVEKKNRMQNKEKRTTDLRGSPTNIGYIYGQGENILLTSFFCTLCVRKYFRHNYYLVSKEMKNKIMKVCIYVHLHLGPVLPNLFSVQFNSIQFSSIQFSLVQFSSVQIWMILLLSHITIHFSSV